MARFAELYLDQSLTLDPVRASAQGNRRGDRLLPDWSPAGIARSLATLNALERDLLRIDVNKLSSGYAIDHELIGEDIARARFVLERLRPFEWDVPSYPDTLSASFFYLTQPLDDPTTGRARLEAMLARMAAVPQFVARAKQNLKNPPRALTEAAIALVPALIEAFETEIPKLFANVPDLKARFDVERPKVLASLRELAAFLETDLLPRSTGELRLGKGRFEEKLARVGGSTVSADVLYREAEQALETTRFEMYDLAVGLYRELFPGDRAYASLTQDARIDVAVGRVLGKLSEDQGTLGSLLQEVQQDVAGMKKALGEGKERLELPPGTEDLVIEPMPGHLDGVRAVFFSPPPAFAKDRRGRLWVANGPGHIQGEEATFLREYNRHALRALTAHEAFPGRFVQYAFAERSPSASITQRVLASTTSADGWALLAEDLAFRPDAAGDAKKTRLFVLKARLRMLASAMVDIRFHTGSEDDKAFDAWALQLFEKSAFQDEAEAIRRLRRAKLTPGQLAHYFAAYRDMRAIYDRGRDRAKSDAPPRAFVEALLTYGALPPRLIRRHLEADGHL